MLPHTQLVLFFVLVFSVSTLQAQEGDEIKRLTDKISLLEEKLALAQKENELLKKEIELLKAKPSKPDKEAAKKSVSDLLPVGATITGNWRSQRTEKDGFVGFGTISISITSRDGKKFKADCSVTNQNKVTSNYNIQGNINGSKLSWETVGNSSQIKASLIRRSEEALEGQYEIPTTRDLGTVGLTLPKVEN